MEKERMKKRLFTVIVILIALVLPITSLVSHAWLALTNLRLGSLSGVDKPSPFAITGPYGVGGSDVQVDFIGVNASTKNQVEGVNRKQYLFCVEGASFIKQYYVVIAHTTNVDFTYSLYMSDTAPSGVYSEVYSGQLLERPFYYNNHEIKFTSLNRQTAPNANLAIRDSNNVYYNSTYYDGGGALDTQYVQENAMPIYEYAHIEFGAGYSGRQYYILNVSWTVEDSTSPLEHKQKETDMVYVFVKTTLSGYES